MEKKNKNVKTVEAQLIKSVNDDTDQVKKFAFILMGVALVALLLYIFSSKVLIKDGDKKDNDSTTKEVDIVYSTVDVGGVFNRPYDEYYVLAYDPDSLEAPIYSMMLSKVGKDKGKMYFLNMGSEINKPYIKEESNKSASSASEIAIKGPTMIKISKGKIVKYIEGLEEIQKEYEKELK